ncbi:MAG: hypothetical protein CFE23_11455 [Flavobacterium sp. BFFFF1]|uniref:hypothetical protein n=1 Tax=Flavobacterium sp. BFFFF1 TaxID=2015557 RepID=UPI000BC832D6|nr:hypothetical protein [Flavobacterium sp. BFFFF1]OYU79996.1 MAG: hypothetical protein CFE23_11455 [Flavobacterium sp. BFFFF1]
MENNSAFDSFEMQLTDNAKQFLRETGKWANFLSIFGYIWMGLILVFGSLGVLGSNDDSGMDAATNMYKLPPGMTLLVIVIMVAISFFPIFYLNRFALSIKAAFRDNNTEKLTASFEYLKSHYKFVGIFTLVMLVIYALAIIVVIVAAATGAAS